MKIKIFILSLFFAVHAQAFSLDDQSLLTDRLFPSILPSILVKRCMGLMVSGPCDDNLVAYWTDKWITDNTALKDRSTSATHEATKAQYLDIDTPYTITFSGMGAGVTLTSHGGTATVDLTSGTLTCSVAGTLFDMVLSDGTQYACAEGEGTLIAPTIAGINGILVGFTLPADRPESSITGKSWNGSSGYVIADGTGTFDSGAYLPATYASEGTLYPGKAQQNLLVEAFVPDLAGTETLTLTHLTGSETVTTKRGTSTVAITSGQLTFTAGTISYLLLSDGTELIFEGIDDAGNTQINAYNVDGTFRHGTFVGGTTPLFTETFTPSYLAQYGGLIAENLLKWSEDLTQSDWAVTGGVTKQSETLFTFAAQYERLLQNIITVEGVTYTYSFKARTVSGNVLLQAYHSNSATGTFQPVTITSTLTDYEVSFLGKVGGGEVGLGLQDRNATGYGQMEFTEIHISSSDGSYIKTEATAIPLSVVPYEATDQPNTFSGIHDAPADIFNVNGPETLEMYNADDTNIFLDAVTGLAKDVDPYDIPENTGDKILSSDNGISVADPAQTGDCLSQTED